MADSAVEEEEERQQPQQEEEEEDDDDEDDEEEEEDEDEDEDEENEEDEDDDDEEEEEEEVELGGIEWRRKSVYPAELVDHLFQAAYSRRKSRKEWQSFFNNYCQYPIGRTSFMWRKLHCTPISPTIKFSGNRWVYGSNMSSEPEYFGMYADNISPENDADFFAIKWNEGDDLDTEDMNIGYPLGRAMDLDIEDGAGKLYQVRLVINLGHTYGAFGKAFDRCSVLDGTDRTQTSPVVLAEFFISEALYIPKIVPADSIRSDFVPHEDLNSLFDFLTNDCENHQLKGIFDHQFSMLLCLCHCIAGDDDIKDQCERPRVVNGESLQSLMLRMLGKYEEGSPNANNVAAQVLCGGTGSGLGQCHKLIAEYSSERYITGNDTKLDDSLHWYIDWVVGLIYATRMLDKEGDVEGCYEALERWQEEIHEEYSWIWRADERDLEDPRLLQDDNGKPDEDKIRNKYLDKFKPLTLGLEHDDDEDQLLYKQIYARYRHKLDKKHPLYGSDRLK